MAEIDEVGLDNVMFSHNQKIEMGRMSEELLTICFTNWHSKDPFFWIMLNKMFYGIWFILISVYGRVFVAVLEDMTSFLENILNSECLTITFYLHLRDHLISFCLIQVMRKFLWRLTHVSSRYLEPSATSRSNWCFSTNLLTTDQHASFLIVLEHEIYWLLHLKIYGIWPFWPFLWMSVLGLSYFCFIIHVPGWGCIFHVQCVKRRGRYQFHKFWRKKRGNVFMVASLENSI